MLRINWQEIFIRMNPRLWSMDFVQISREVPEYGQWLTSSLKPLSHNETISESLISLLHYTGYLFNYKFQPWNTENGRTYMYKVILQELDLQPLYLGRSPDYFLREYIFLPLSFQKPFSLFWMFIKLWQYTVILNKGQGLVSFDPAVYREHALRHYLISGVAFHDYL